MNFGRYRFAPPWWGVLLFALGATIFCALGVWQIERAHHKQALVAAEQAARAAGTQAMQPEGAVTTGDARVAPIEYGREYFVTGRFDAGQQVLLTDQLRGTQAGYHVWTPLVLNNGLRVMVDRGWVARPPRGEPLPDPGAPSATVRIKGFWRSLVTPALQWGAASACDERSWPQPMSYPDAARLRCQYDMPVLDGVLLLDPADPNGFVRDWAGEKDTVGLRPFGHYAYASQWFLMAFVAGVILVVVNLSRR